MEQACTLVACKLTRISAIVKHEPQTTQLRVVEVTYLYNDVPTLDVILADPGSEFPSVSFAYLSAVYGNYPWG